MTHPNHAADPAAGADLELLKSLRHHRSTRRRHPKPPVEPAPPTAGERMADWVAERVGSWRFILVQSTLLAFWIAANVLAWVHSWDPYPFILLNLVLSFQAAYTAPIIMMSQNRAAAIDRQRAQDDYDINIKAELEIELLHQKIDLLREKEIVRLTGLIEKLEQRLAAADKPPSPTTTA